ncbi:MAG: hypothetical protein DWQ05_00650 [Calditrichaeota bacterium]|nr:MAG: hypothetical protein DWQ05_00650 [Calditrichota bacterium]
MVATYINVCEEFKQAYQSIDKPEDLPHKTLSTLADMLFDLKEHSKLIYKPFVKSSSMRKAIDHRFKPDTAEVDFLILIGLLYHKMVVTRELKYLYDHYDAVAQNFTDSKDDLLVNIHNILTLLKKSLPALLSFLRFNSGNITLLAFLISVSTKMKKCIGIRGPELIRSILGDENIEEKYLLAGEYFLESGWFDESEKVIKRVLRKDPGNEHAQNILEKLPSPVQSQ